MNKRRRYQAKRRRLAARQARLPWLRRWTHRYPNTYRGNAALLGVDLAAGPDCYVEHYHARLGPIVETIRRSTSSQQSGYTGARATKEATKQEARHVTAAECYAFIHIIRDNQG